MGNGLILILMIGVLIFNAYGIMQVGIDNASTMQWAATGLMAVFVAIRLFQMARRR